MIRRAYGYKPDRHDVRDRLFKPRAFRPGAFPPSVDLRPGRPSGLDQGNLGSCVIHAVTCVLRRHLILAGSKDYPLSRLQLYYNTREMEDCIQEDSGVEIRDAVRCVKDRGVAPETLWPYVEDRFRDPPPAAAQAAADVWGDFTYERVPVSNYGLKSALAEGLPVIIGTQLFDSFESDEVERTGIVPLPASNEGEVGGHSMVSFGYGQKAGHYTCQNWWGDGSDGQPAWGDKGDCYLPESYLANPQYSSDFWVIKNIDIQGK